MIKAAESYLNHLEIVQIFCNGCIIQFDLLFTALTNISSCRYMCSNDLVCCLKVNINNVKYLCIFI